jgi:putative aldouronate transport system substrate-binding protein
MVKRIYFAFFILMLMVGSGYAAGRNDRQRRASSSETAEFTIDWYVNLSWWAWNGLGWGQDLVSQKIKEETGANINFVTPAAEGGEQLATMIAADTLPDLITLQGLWDSTDRFLAYQLAMEGYILSYNEMFDLAPELRDVVRKDVIDWYAEKDGKTYFYPNYAYSSQDLAPGEKLVPNRAITIRKDLWEAIGSPDISTPDKFLAACKMVKDRIKTYDGKEIIGLQLYESANEALDIMNQYFAMPREYPDGKSTNSWDMPQNREALAFLNEAYRMDLVTDANFSDTRDMINEKVAGGRVFAMITAPQDFIQQMAALWDADHNAVYQSVALRNHRGDDPVLGDISGWGWLQTGVSKKTKDQAKVANLIKFLLSDEGQILSAYGVEGTTYTKKADGKFERTEEYITALNANNDRKYAVGAMTLFANYAFTRRFDSDSTNPRTIATSDLLIKDPLRIYSYNFSSAGGKEDPSNPRKQEMTELTVRLNNYSKTAVAELITAPSAQAFEIKYAEVVTTLKSMGLDRLHLYNEEWFQAGKKAMGVKFIWPPYIE